MKRLAKKVDDFSAGRIRPDHITLLSLFGHIPVVALIVANQLIWAGVLLIIFGILDTLDGELARLQHAASPQGMVLDASTDRLKEVLLFSAIGYWLVEHDYAQYAWLAIVACGCSLAVSYVKAKGEVAIAVTDKKIHHHTLNRFFDEGIVPFEIRIGIIIIGLIADQLLAVTILIAVLSSISVLQRIVSINKALK